MTPRSATSLAPAQKAQRELEDLQLALRARNGDEQALDQLIRRYTGFVRLKASSYFLAGGEEADSDCTLGDALPGPGVDEPSVCVVSTEELQSLVFCLGTGLSPLESDALRLYLEGSSYEEMATELACDTKTIDNALQRVKRKILNHQQG